MNGRGYNSVESHIVHQANLDIVTIERILLLCTFILIEVHSGVCLLKTRIRFSTKNIIIIIMIIIIIIITVSSCTLRFLSIITDHHTVPIASIMLLSFVTTLPRPPPEYERGFDQSLATAAWGKYLGVCFI